MDARSPQEFGNGNIPGSVNVPFSKFVNTDGMTIKSVEERTAAAAEAGIDLNKPIVVTCNRGIKASCFYAALSDIHKSRLAVYDGSYAEYSKK